MLIIVAAATDKLNHMSRYNIFNQVHKALRAMLYDTLLTLQQTWFADTEEAESALQRVNKVLRIFDAHARHEDDFVLPAIAQYEPGLVDAFEQEHKQDHVLSESLRGLMLVYRHAMKAGVKIETGDAINRAFTEFMIFNLQHMNREETILNKVLWRYYSDAELFALNQQIVASIPPAEITETSTWMMRGMNNAEITAWLKAVEKNAPQQALAGLLNLAESELPAERYQKLQESLTEGMQIL